ncbi:MAG: TolC family protein [Gammaproteobacteria bacterium]|nr:TolC family protein [Gammaproteobacteria bacterium]
MMRRAALAFAVALPAAAAHAEEPLRLTLEQAMQRAQAAGAAVRLAGQGVAQAAANEDAVRAALRPQLSADVSQTRRTTNLKAQGIEFPGAPTRVGPFDTFDARLRLSQTVFDYSAILAARGAALGPEYAQAQAAAAREQAAARAALAYIAVLRDRQALVAAETDLRVAEELYGLAEDRHKAGVASGVDVARARTALAQDRFALARAQATLSAALIDLRRAAELPLDRELDLADDLRFDEEVLPDADAALRRARERRPELAALAARLRQAELEARAARARRWPTVALFADYGESANSPARNDEYTYLLGARLSLPILSGGAIEAGEAAAQARLDEVRVRRDDALAQVEQDVRLALVQAGSSAEQVRAAQATRELAERELELARDRFAQGVTGNVEVVEAQASLARARAGYVDALAALHVARADLAAAQGAVREFRLAAPAAAPEPAASGGASK